MLNPHGEEQAKDADDIKGIDAEEDTKPLKNTTMAKMFFYSELIKYSSNYSQNGI